MEPSNGLIERTATLMFTDIEGSTALGNRRGDVQAHELVSRHQELVRDQVAMYGGREVRTAGDGFFIAFDAARNALRCALSIHRSLSEERAQGSSVRLRIGVNSGDILCSGAEISGVAISAAARLVAIASPGEVLVSGVVRELADPLPGARFVYRGEHDMKGFERPMRVYDVKEERCLTVAIAEDNLLVREGMTSLLGLYSDMRVAAICGDLEEIRAATRTRTPDVVITDIRMPPTGTDEGLRLAEWLGEEYPSVGVVALSQYAEAASVRRLLASGSSGRAFLLKESLTEGTTLRDAVRGVSRGEIVLDPLLGSFDPSGRERDRA